MNEVFACSPISSTRLSERFARLFQQKSYVRHSSAKFPKVDPRAVHAVRGQLQDCLDTARAVQSDGNEPTSRK